MTENDWARFNKAMAEMGRAIREAVDREAERVGRAMRKWREAKAKDQEGQP
jgi:hypothetical protein